MRPHETRGISDYTRWSSCVSVLKDENGRVITFHIPYRILLLCVSVRGRKVSRVPRLELRERASRNEQIFWLRLPSNDAHICSRRQRSLGCTLCLAGRRKYFSRSLNTSYSTYLTVSRPPIITTGVPPVPTLAILCESTKMCWNKGRTPEESGLSKIDTTSLYLMLTLLNSRVCVCGVHIGAEKIRIVSVSNVESTVQ